MGVPQVPPSYAYESYNCFPTIIASFPISPTFVVINSMIEIKGGQPRRGPGPPFTFCKPLAPSALTNCKGMIHQGLTFNL